MKNSDCLKYGHVMPLSLDLEEPCGGCWGKLVFGHKCTIYQLHKGHERLLGHVGAWTRYGMVRVSTDVVGMQGEYML